jgi:hypothetical protein
MVKFVVTMPAGTLTVTAALPPLLTVKVAGLVSIVVTNIKSASRLIPFGGPNGSPVQTTPFGVGRYQYTN